MASCNPPGKERFMPQQSRLALAALAFVSFGFGLSHLQSQDAAPDPAALARTREKIQMLDDAYKAAVIHITDTYVRAQEQTPAARVAKKVFAHMEQKGWHSARLIDVTGQPINRGNAPATEFEKLAAKEMKNGKGYFDQVATRDGKPVLRAATVVPVVMKACITCHPGYKEGDVLGAIVYEMPIK
jgi:hypothetical protein